MVEEEEGHMVHVVGKVAVVVLLLAGKVIRYIESLVERER